MCCRPQLGRHQVDRLGGAADEDDLLGVGPQEPRHRLPGTLVGIGRPGGQLVRGAVDVGVLVLVEVLSRSITACGFCVVAALSNHTSCLPLTRSDRIGKSRRTACRSYCGRGCTGDPARWVGRVLDAGPLGQEVPAGCRPVSDRRVAPGPGRPGRHGRSQVRRWTATQAGAARPDRGGSGTAADPIAGSSSPGTAEPHRRSARQEVEGGHGRGPRGRRRRAGSGQHGRAAELRWHRGRTGRRLGQRAWARSAVVGTVAGDGDDPTEPPPPGKVPVAGSTASGAGGAATGGISGAVGTRRRAATAPARARNSSLAQRATVASSGSPARRCPAARRPCSAEVGGCVVMEPARRPRRPARPRRRRSAPPAEQYSEIR